MLRDVSGMRALVRCRSVDSIPRELSLWVDDRRFRILVVVESWEAAPPILLGEADDLRLGLASREDQDAFAARLNVARPSHPSTSGTAVLVPRVRSGTRLVSGVGDSSSFRGSSAPASGAKGGPLAPPLLMFGSTGGLGGPSIPGSSPAEGLASSSFPPLASAPLAVTTAAGEGGPAFPCIFASSSAKGETAHNRRSRRLATKRKGRTLTPILRAQDLLCRKHKLVKIAVSAA